jgi:hypothetical protein
MIYFAQDFRSPLDELPPSIISCFGLVLNPMRGRMEEQRLIAVSDSKPELERLLTEERVENYRDENWSKCYRSGGPLEWFNPPTFPDRADDWGHGIIELRRDGWRRVA